MGSSVMLASLRATLIRTPKPFPLQIQSRTAGFLCLPLYHYHFASSSSSSSSSRFTTSAAALETASSSLSSPAQNCSWPEWSTFVDRLKSRGYLIPPTTSLEDNDDSRWLYKDINLLKNACLSFARDRFDVFSSLSKDDVQALVESGCPNINRKVVNSAKRLRAYTGFIEADACDVCDLRRSCDRAYVTLQESEAAARTVDIVRILLFYALEQSANSDGVKPAAREQAELSAKRLLSELVELSEAPQDPGLVKPQSYKKDPSVNKVPKNVDAGREDWTCPKCSFLNFSRNVKCLKCSEPDPSNSDSEAVEMKKGDWICPECNFMNFSRNIQCRECKAEGPKKVDMHNIEMKKGDWNCSQCGFMNFASNSKCHRCTEGSRPPRQLKPGDWECPSCDFWNFRGNVVCRKCQKRQSVG